MVLRLDPRVPILWRDPFSLQFGVEPARVVLREVSNAQEQIIAALAMGVSEPALAMVATAAGVSDADASRLLSALEPVLRAEEEPRACPEVAIVGRGPTVDRIASALAESGVAVSVSTAVSDSPCDLGIAVGHYVFDPDVYGFWLRRDVPHLPVVFADGTATVGPFIEPGTGPCLYCLEFYRRDVDPRWSTLASQLWGVRSAAETPLGSREAATMASRLVVRRLADGSPVAGATATSFRLGADDGVVVRREWLPHPDCGCILPNADLFTPTSGPATTESPRESGSAGVATIDPNPPLPRRAEAFGEPA